MFLLNHLYRNHFDSHIKILALPEGWCGFDDGERALIGAPAAASFRSPNTARTLKKPAIFGEPLWSVQQRVLERPIGVDVLFERRIELRCECVENLSSLPGTFDIISPPLYARNVMPSPEDFTHQGRKIISEQWIEIEFYLDFLKLKTPSGLLPLSIDVLFTCVVLPCTSRRAAIHK